MVYLLCKSITNQTLPAMSATKNFHFETINGLNEFPQNVDDSYEDYLLMEKQNREQQEQEEINEQESAANNRSMYAKQSEEFFKEQINDLPF